jgi:hypothetical protein
MQQDEYYSVPARVVFFRLIVKVMNADEVRALHDRLMIRNTAGYSYFPGKWNNFCTFVSSSFCNEIVHILGFCFISYKSDSN